MRCVRKNAANKMFLRERKRLCLDRYSDLDSLYEAVSLLAVFILNFLEILSREHESWFFKEPIGFAGAFDSCGQVIKGTWGMSWR